MTNPMTVDGETLAEPLADAPRPVAAVADRMESPQELLPVWAKLKLEELMAEAGYIRKLLDETPDWRVLYALDVFGGEPARLDLAADEVVRVVDFSKLLPMLSRACRETLAAGFSTCDTNYRTLNEGNGVVTLKPLRLAKSEGGLELVGPVRGLAVFSFLRAWANDNPNMPTTLAVQVKACLNKRLEQMVVPQGSTGWQLMLDDNFRDSHARVLATVLATLPYGTVLGDGCWKAVDAPLAATWLDPEQAHVPMWHVGRKGSRLGEMVSSYALVLNPDLLHGDQRRLLAEVWQVARRAYGDL